MAFQERRDREARGADRHAAFGGQHGGQRVARGDAVHGQPASRCLFQRDGAREGGGTGAAGLKARAFLVGPGHDFDRAAGDDTGLVDRLKRLESGQHAEGAVELAAGRLGIQMGAGDDGGKGFVGTRTVDEQVADRVGFDGKPQFLRPAGQKAARLGIALGQCRTIDAAIRQGADLRHGHMALPEASLIDGNEGGHGEVALNSVLGR